jgi:hypothetical protein
MPLAKESSAVLAARAVIGEDHPVFRLLSAHSPDAFATLRSGG